MVYLEASKVGRGRGLKGVVWFEKFESGFSMKRIVIGL